MKLINVKAVSEDADRTTNVALDAESIATVEQLPESTPKRPLSRIKMTSGDAYTVIGDPGLIAEQTVQSGALNFFNSTLGIFVLTTVLVTLGGALLKWLYGQYTERATMVSQEKLLLREFDFRLSQIEYRRSQIEESQTDPHEVVNLALYIYRIVYGDVPSSLQGTFHSVKPEFQKQSLASVVMLLSNISQQPMPTDTLKILSDMEMEKGEIILVSPSGRAYPRGLLEARIAALKNYSQTQWKRVYRWW